MQKYCACFVIYCRVCSAKTQVEIRERINERVCSDLPNRNQCCSDSGVRSYLIGPTPSMVCEACTVSMSFPSDWVLESPILWKHEEVEDQKRTIHTACENQFWFIIPLLPVCLWPHSRFDRNTIGRGLHFYWRSTQSPVYHASFLLFFTWNFLDLNDIQLIWTNSPQLSKCYISDSAFYFKITLGSHGLFSHYGIGTLGTAGCRPNPALLEAEFASSMPPRSGLFGSGSLEMSTLASATSVFIHNRTDLWGFSMRDSKITSFSKEGTTCH